MTYETKDSGARQEWASGMKRDTEEGKARFDLIIPEGVPYQDQLLTRLAELLGRGAVKYDARNWEQASGEEEIARAKSSAFRHFMQWLTGEEDEDHAAATIFNLLVVETTRSKMAAAEDVDFDAAADSILRDDAVVDWGQTATMSLEAKEVSLETMAVVLGLPLAEVELMAQSAERDAAIAAGSIPQRFIVGVAHSHFTVAEDGVVTQNVEPIPTRPWGQSYEDWAADQVTGAVQASINRLTH